jgi:hypothetical protein
MSDVSVHDATGKIPPTDMMQARIAIAGLEARCLSLTQLQTGFGHTKLDQQSYPIVYLLLFPSTANTATLLLTFKTLLAAVARIHSQPQLQQAVLRRHHQEVVHHPQASRLEEADLAFQQTMMSCEWLMLSWHPFHSSFSFHSAPLLSEL